MGFDMRRENTVFYEPHVGLNHNNQIAGIAIASVNYNLFY